MKETPAKRVKVLLFDVDGTLVRAGGSGRRALDAAIGRLYGRRGSCRELDLAGKTDLRNFREAVAAAGGAPGPRALARVHREYLRRLPRHVASALRGGRYRLCPGVAALLRRLSREDGVLLGLGTGNVEEGARIKLGPSGLNRYFPFGGFGSDSFHRPALLRKALRRARGLLNGRGRALRPRDVYVIGDTPLDVEAGRKAGFRTIGVGTGFASWEALAASRPDHLAKDFRRIEQWLDWLGLRRRTARRPRRKAARPC